MTVTPQDRERAREFLERWKAPPSGEWMMPTKELAELLAAVRAEQKEVDAKIADSFGTVSILTAWHRGDGLALGEKAWKEVAADFADIKRRIAAAIRAGVGGGTEPAEDAR